MVKSTEGVAVLYREGVHHARLRRLGTEGRQKILSRSFESAENFLPESTKLNHNRI